MEELLLVKIFNKNGQEKTDSFQKLPLFSSRFVILDDVDCEKSPAEKKECPCLVTFFNFHALFFLIPFRILMDSTSNEYVLESSKIRKVKFVFYWKGNDVEQEITL